MREQVTACSFRGFGLVRTLLPLLFAQVRFGFAARRRQKPKQKRSDKSEPTKSCGPQPGMPASASRHTNVRYAVRVAGIPHDEGWLRDPPYAWREYALRGLLTRAMKEAERDDYK